MEFKAPINTKVFSNGPPDSNTRRRLLSAYKVERTMLSAVKLQLYSISPQLVEAESETRELA